MLVEACVCRSVGRSAFVDGKWLQVLLTLRVVIRKPVDERWSRREEGREQMMSTTTPVEQESRMLLSLPKQPSNFELDLLLWLSLGLTPRSYN